MTTLCHILQLMELIIAIVTVNVTVILNSDDLAGGCDGDGVVELVVVVVVVVGDRWGRTKDSDSGSAGSGEPVLPPSLLAGLTELGPDYLHSVRNLARYKFRSADAFKNLQQTVFKDH